MPHESQTRIAIFFTASAIAGAFSGLLAFLVRGILPTASSDPVQIEILETLSLIRYLQIVKMDGTAGYEGWRWVSSPRYVTMRSITNVVRSSFSKVSLPSSPGSPASGFLWTRPNTPAVGCLQTKSATSNCDKRRQDASSQKATKRRHLTGEFSDQYSSTGRSIS